MPGPPILYRFGTYEADPTTGELRRKGVRVKLNAQPFQLLCLLLDRPNQLLTRDEIASHLWPEGTFVDFEHGLNSAVNRIREALNDSAANPRFLETLARRGYRFLAPVEKIAATQEPDSPEQAIPTESSRQPPPPPGAPGLDLRTRDSITPTFAPSETAPFAPAAGKPSDPNPTNASQNQTPPPDARPEPPSRTTLLATEADLPKLPHAITRNLFLLLQLMYLAFYIGALANLPEITQLLTPLPWPGPTLTTLIATAAILIPARVFIVCATLMHPPRARATLLRLWPFLLLADLLWSLAPFLLLHHIDFGVALACTAILLYSPFAQRSLILMGAAQPVAQPAASL